MSLFNKSGVVNIRMIITEEKILSNIDKVQKMIDPNNKKQIIQLEDDAFFKDLISSIKTYLTEYPNKKSFPADVYTAAQELVEYSTSQFEENTKQIETLIRKREVNIKLAQKLKSMLILAENKETSIKEELAKSAEELGIDVVTALQTISRAKVKTTENYLDAMKVVKSKITNLETNLHIEIDMDRIEDRSKALSYIGIEVAESLKEIPCPLVKSNKKAVAGVAITDKNSNGIAIAQGEVQDEYYDETRIDVKPTLWERVKNMKLFRFFRNVTKLRLQLVSADDVQQQNVVNK
jgi:hypothetical protein